ncbi:hypothetical protein ACKVMT_10265 [Halobacteriales archaeon Cl-PHB]
MLTAIAPAAAANATTPATTSPTPEAGERIDSGLVLLDATYDEDTETIVATFRATEPTAVTIADAGAFQEGGTIATTTAIVQPGSPQQLRVSATKVRGFVGISVSTDDVLYAVPIEVDGALIGGPWTAQDAQISAIAAALCVSLFTVVMAIRRLTGHADEGERIA